MIDEAPILILHLTAGYTPAGRMRSIAMIVNAQGFTLAYSDHDPASNLRDALCPGSHVVTITVPATEIRERKAMAAASNRMLGIGGGNIAARFERALNAADRKASDPGSSYEACLLARTS